MENLPGDLIIKILISLPLISIGRCRVVSKSWYILLDEEFVSMKRNYDTEHENLRLLVIGPRETVDYGVHGGVEMDNILPEIVRQKVESKSLISSEDAGIIMYPFKEKPSDSGCDGITIVGSCNGLICAYHAGNIFYVWNPCTGEYRVIRSPFGFRGRCFGFGYDSKACDYKFVSIYQKPDMHVSQVEIYTLGSNSWENYHSYNPYEISQTIGVFLNGAVHWLANLRGGWRTRYLISSMDIGDGVFREIPQPEQMDDSGYKFIDVLRGCLCLLCSVSNTKYEIWEMKDYGVRESWSKVFNIDPKELMPMVTMDTRSCGYIRRVVSLKDGEILLEINVINGYRKRFDVVKIHLDETKRCQNKRGYEYLKNIRKMEAYVESLDSVKSGTFVWKEQKDCYRFEELPQLLLPEIPELRYLRYLED